MSHTLPRDRQEACTMEWAGTGGEEEEGREGTAGGVAFLPGGDMREVKYILEWGGCWVGCSCSS